LLLTAGGDERIVLDPATGRNRYGVAATPSPDEIFLSSSTASTITPRAYCAADAAWAALSGGSAARPPRLDGWFDSLRARILDLFGIVGAGVVLAGSGTEAELVALAIARCVLPGPIANVVLAPSETGSGVLRAAAGAYFLGSTPFGGTRSVGERLQGWARADIDAMVVEIRDRQGDLRSAKEVDDEARHRAFEALAVGRSVLLHRLETSKTGSSGLTLAAAAQIAARAPDRVAVVVDCCQLRCSRRRIRHYLACGFMVAITGSKFFGGPPFSGALLLPPRLLQRIGKLALPTGLADYSSALDWPDDLRAESRLRWANHANLGLGLRWVAALAEIERYYGLPGDLRRRVLDRFAGHVRKSSQSVENIHMVGADLVEPPRRPDSILPFVMTHPDGTPYSLAETAAIHSRLRQATRPAGGRAAAQMFHLGQPVAIGARTALRVCASAPLVSDIAERVVAGESLERAFAPWGGNVEALFEKWRGLMIEASAERNAPPLARTGLRRVL
jgi:hypothetical protein